MNFDELHLLADEERILLNGENLKFNFKFPLPFVEGTTLVDTNGEDGTFEVWVNGKLHNYEKNEENYNVFIIPLIALWETENERLKPTQEEIEAQIQKQLTDAVQSHLDSKAQELNYDSCLSVCSYVDTGVPKFDAESSAFRKWRSAVWQTCYQILDDCLNGVREIPTTETLIAELPPLVINYEEE